MTAYTFQLEGSRTETEKESSKKSEEKPGDIMS